MYNLFIKLISTFFYVGYLPFIPGTFGSLAGVFLIYFIQNNTFLYLLVTLVLLIMGFCTAGKAAELFKRPDPKYVVIDEVAGMLVSFLFLPYDLKLLIIGFFIFRVLDTLKPFPASRLERLHGSAGIMSDDLAAGIYTNIILQVVWRLVSFTVS